MRIIERLTDASVMHDPVMRAVLDNNCDVIKQMGWERAGAVEKYNAMSSLGYVETPDDGIAHHEQVFKTNWRSLHGG